MSEPAMTVQDLALKANSERISVQVQKQEILGLAGLDGHGQAQFLESLAGVFRPDSGSVMVGQHHIRSLRDAKRAQVSYMPSDRKKNGIFPGLSVQDNFTLGNLPRFGRFGWRCKGRAEAALDIYRDTLSMAYADRKVPISSLSGGNQQKVLLARAMECEPRVMLLNDPTRGVDIQTRKTLYSYLRQCVEQMEMTLVLLSTELDELIELCDRVIVFRDFGVSARLVREQLDMDQLIAAMFGQTSQTTQGAK